VADPDASLIDWRQDKDPATKFVRADAPASMLTSLCRFAQEFVPFRPLAPPEQFAADVLCSAEHQAVVAELRAAVAATDDEARLKEFRDIANARISDEAGRQASIITRAQGLFVGLALFGFLFTFGAGLLTQTMRIQRWELWICLVLVAFILLQMIVMVMNILRAIRGIGYPTFGTSDLTTWLGSSDNAGFYRSQRLLVLDHYRVAERNNTWRVHYLQFALKGLRNIVFTLSALIMFLLVIGVLTPPPPPPAAPMISLPGRCGHSHWWRR
jgi:hypothetical protein